MEINQPIIAQPGQSLHASALSKTSRRSLLVFGLVPKLAGDPLPVKCDYVQHPAERNLLWRETYAVVTGLESQNAFHGNGIALTFQAQIAMAPFGWHRGSFWVLGEDGKPPMLNSSLDHVHRELRATLGLPKDSVLHSLRHTYGTRLGESGADAFTILRLMGHSSVTVSQRYVHPTPHALERAVEQLQGMNRKAARKLRRAGKRHLPATIPATFPNGVPVSH